MRRCLSSALVSLVAGGASAGCAEDTSDLDVAAAESESTVRAIHLTDGSVVRGEPVAAYDHSTWWWDASPEITYAVFDPTGSSATPGADRSLRFVDASRIAPAQAPITVPPAPPSS